MVSDVAHSKNHQVYKLATEAEKKWQRLHGCKLLEKVIEGVEFVNGEMKQAA